MINLTINEGMNNLNNFTQTCVLNQYEMVNALRKIPQKLFWVLVFATLVYMINLYLIPLLKEKLKDNYNWIVNALHSLSFSCLFLGLWALALFTFEITNDMVKKMGYIMYPIFILSFLFIAYKRGWFKKINEFLNKGDEK